MTGPGIEIPTNLTAGSCLRLDAKVRFPAVFPSLTFTWLLNLISLSTSQGELRYETYGGDCSSSTSGFGVSLAILVLAVLGLSIILRRKTQK